LSDYALSVDAGLSVEEGFSAVSKPDLVQPHASARGLAMAVTWSEQTLHDKLYLFSPRGFLGLSSLVDFPAYRCLRCRHRVSDRIS
jgi:hypothetical protein